MTEHEALKALIEWFDAHGVPPFPSSLGGRVEDAKKALSGHDAVKDLIDWIDNSGSTFTFAELMKLTRAARPGYSETSQAEHVDISANTRYAIDKVARPSLVITCVCGSAMAHREEDREFPGGNTDDYYLSKNFLEAHKECHG